MLDSDMYPFGDDPLPDLLVNYDSDGAGVDVEDGSGVSVVILEGHALVDGTIDHNVDDVSVLEGG